MSNDYLKDFLQDDKNNPEPEKTKVKKDLEWINLHPTAEEAFNAIKTLKKEKLRYISGHPSKGSYKTKKPWSISKVEVGRKIGKESQPLFNSNTFSEGLLGYFDQVNIDLHKAKDERLKKRNKGYQHKSKEELKANTIQLTKENKLLIQNTCEELYERMLNELSLDVKHQLGLN